MNFIKAWQKYDNYMAEVMYEWDEDGDDTEGFYEVYTPLTRKIKELQQLNEDWQELSQFLSRRGISTEWIALYSNVENGFNNLFKEDENE